MAARWFSEDPDHTEISLEDKLLRDKIVAVISKYTREMENYSYFGSNPGVSEEDYEDVADEIMQEFTMKEAKCTKN